MIDRNAVLSGPAIRRGITESQGGSSARQAVGSLRESRLFPEHGWAEGWGWDRGELICPLSWLRAEKR